VTPPTGLIFSNENVGAKFRPLFAAVDLLSPTIRVLTCNPPVFFSALFFPSPGIFLYNAHISARVWG
jgi:hypothetical protein